jgi:porin
MGRARAGGIAGVALAAALVGAPPRAAAARAPSGEVRPATAIANHLISSPRLLGDPGGARSRLGSLGVSFQLFANQTLGWKPEGGVDPDGTFGHSGSYDFFTYVDFGELTEWPGLAFLLHVKGQYDRSINGDVGALSDPVDDADSDEPIYVDELWLQQSFLRDRAWLRAGFLEQQTVFDRNAYANNEDRQFMTTFLDNNPLVPLPNGLGAVLFARPVAWLELAMGFGDADNELHQPGFDTAFDDVESLTGYFEVAFQIGVPAAPRSLPGSYRMGVFVDGAEKTVFGRTDPATGLPESERGHVGAYLSFDQVAYREPGNDEQGLGLFARFGYADADVNPVSWFWSLGLQYRGLLPGRPDDVLGLGSYQAIGSSRFRDAVAPDFDRETGVELYYCFDPLPWLAVTPDLQYIVDPGASGAASNAVVVLLRLRVTF